MKNCGEMELRKQEMPTVFSTSFTFRYVVELNSKHWNFQSNNLLDDDVFD